MRDGPSGRRAGLVDGPDVDEVVRAYLQVADKAQAAKQLGLGLEQVQTALDYFAVHPDDIEARLRANGQATLRIERAFVTSQSQPAEGATERMAALDKMLDELDRVHGEPSQQAIADARAILDRAARGKPSQ